MMPRARHHRLIRHISPMVATALVLSSCQTGPVGGPLTLEVAAVSSVSALQPLNDAGLRCWIRSGDRRFRNYRLVPELDTSAGNPRILVTERGKETGRPQLVIEATDDPVKISTYGPLANTRLANRINADITRWSGGDTSCAG